MIPKVHCVSLVLTALGVKYHGIVSCMLATLPKLPSLPASPPKDQNSELGTMFEIKSKKGNRKTHSTVRRAAFFRRRYAVLAGFSYALKISTEVSNMLEWPVSCSVELLQTIFYRVMFTFPW